MNFLIINGPNLNLLGTREKSIYGEVSFETYFEQLQVLYSKIKLEYYQSNIEGELINEIHRVGFSYDGIVLNAGAYTHTSLALADAISAVNTPVVEVHISNVHKRELVRHSTMIGKACLGTISGFGMDSYRLGIEGLLKNCDKR
ncbi:type II 3-dehydroquinate dehydratase [Labilibaculum sp. K2S]|uniref:type II 3-dehydroquinate dehydratase n=1 Tax=Labilibaculum sp. K2S TaxID=3056386 RepID=UPI0025A32893|nr:type II 3-dehydroquinate dehydratase [Labilibaculum sp. K2S]MDM8159801.1 type II 3-dehydroquinate dehydratase [Labilibaculum sp. K2S]